MGKWTDLNERLESGGLVEWVKGGDLLPYGGSVTLEDLFGADKVNAQLSDEFGDTPYSAPPVDRKTGICGGGDAWPHCCRGHGIKDFVMWKSFDEQDAEKR
jgi:hypothetical protein